MKKVELLAPAGSFESFLGAIHAGADAVYIGGQKYGARAYAENFTEEEVCLAIRYAHLFGKKLYLTVNTLVREQEMQEVFGYLAPFYEEGLDGVIIQDMGVFLLLKEHFPHLELHASTQMSVTGMRGAAFLKRQGASRVVPARELSLQEIRKIKETGIEVEAFVHGAMCYSYSGQCLLSSMLGGRSGNRGRCAQPCRLPYQIKESRSEKEKYPLSLKDMCTLPFLPELIEAGIDSFKIEGRMKKPEYAAGVTALYRKYIDRYYADPSAEFRVEKEDMEHLKTLYIRSEIQDGYYHRHNGREMITPDKPSYLGADENYIRQIRKQYLEMPFKLPVSGEIFLEKGQPPRFILSRETGQGVVSFESQAACCAEAAQKQPLTKADIRKQIGRMGNTPFVLSEFMVHMEEDVFVPVKSLNDLRREVLGGLEEKLLSEKKRALPYGASAGGGCSSDPAGREMVFPADPYLPYLAVQVQEEEQLDIVLGRKETGRIYVDADMFAPVLGREDEERKRKLRCWKEEQAERKVFPVLPLIIRLLDEPYLAYWKKELLDEPLWDGVVIRNLESLYFLKEIGFTGEILADANLYVWNKTAKRFFQEQGIFLSAPAECNKKDWQRLGLDGMEVPVYGRNILMVSANCVRKTEISCLKKINPAVSEKGSAENKRKKSKEWLLLQDRYRTEFPVRCVCRHCYNEIYNSIPLSLHEYGKSIMSEEPAGIRLIFTTENAGETKEVLNCYHDFTSQPQKKRQAAFSYTKGHYKRGAE